MLIVCGLAGLSVNGQKLSSPNGKISVRFQLPLAGEQRIPSLSVGYKGAVDNVLKDAGVGLETTIRQFAKNLRLVSRSKPVRIVDEYTMVAGKRQHCRNEGMEQTFYLENAAQQQLAVVIRAYNDGVAFKYRFNASDRGEYLVRELTKYPIAEGKKRWMQSFTQDYEGFYPESATGHTVVKAGRRQWGYPALVECGDGVFALFSESGIRHGHSASRLDNNDEPAVYAVKLADDSLKVSGHWESPWRVIVVGNLADIVSSTLVTDVAAPSVVANPGWIKPGLSSWIYWACNHCSDDFQQVKEYIDLADRMHWPYSLIDWKWDQMKNGGQVEDAIRYALAKGVKPMLWYNSSTAWAGEGAPGPLLRLNDSLMRSKEYDRLHKLGVAGIKIDFFAGDRATSMNYYLDLLKDAASYRLLLNFHGATIPRGWQRTYPHLMTMESVYGAEWYNNNGVMTERAAAHNVTLPFTRNVIGPMDYTPGTFSNSQYPHITSYGHELALPIVFESGLQHMPDRPGAYDSLPAEARKLLSSLPTAWDDTRLLAGYPGKDVVIARRKGKTWYIAGLNGTAEPRKLSFTLPGDSKAAGRRLVIKDGKDERSLSIDQQRPASTGKNVVVIDCLPRGGFVMVVEQ